MKPYYLLITFSLLIQPLVLPATNLNKPENTDTITINWDAGKQQIDGFGTAQAGWAHSLYTHYKRDELMECLFGETGLRLNILRGEIFPHYWENETDKSFNLTDEINLPMNHPLLSVDTDDLKRRAQLWVTKQAREKFNITKLLFSTWSPPAYMKSNGRVSDGILKPEFYQEYADYLTAFYIAYQSVGLEPYAISPSNEPGYAAPWNSSVWSAERMGKFITRNLGPTFKKEGIPAKIVFGENPFWSTVTSMLMTVSSSDFVQTLIEEYPEITEYNPVASGHGYTMTEEMGPMKGLPTPIIPFTIAEKNDLPVWMTEISTVDKLDTSMDNGLQWAETFHDYLTNANVNAFIWWAGAIPTGNNESLIILDKDRNGYITSKRLETFGNFTRYIPENSRRIETVVSNPGVLVSAYKKDNHFSLVVINKSQEARQIVIDIPGKTVQGYMDSFLTDENNRWKKGTVVSKKKQLPFTTIPAKSVITLTGTIR